jgi:hypothetical protein
MKKFFIFFAGISAIFNLNAQTWKIKAERFTGDSIVKTVKIKQGAGITVKYFTGLPNEEKTYFGSFLAGSSDSIRIKLKSTEIKTKLDDGSRQVTTIYPGNFFPEKNNALSIAIPEINLIELTSNRGGAAEVGVFACLGVLLVSPLIGIDYGKMKFNTERYAYFAIGSTLGLAVCFTLEGLTSKPKKLRLRPDKPDKTGITWRFM